ncbi:MAG: hypothetical protein K0M66_11160 [Thiobacillus sp.]|nr:hypothetical protein [Thiobacillus sp.]
MSTRAARIENLPLRSLPGALMTPVFAVFVLWSAAPETVQAALPVPKHLISPGTPGIEDPDYLVQRYLDAVDRGELKIFGQTLARSMIVPARVEYVYELSSRTTRIKVHSNLKEPLPVPGQPDCRILGVGAVLEDGIITEIESHVWIKP